MTALEVRLFVSALVALAAGIAWGGAIARAHARDAQLRRQFGTPLPTASAIPTAFRRRAGKGGRA